MRLTIQRPTEEPQSAKQIKVVAWLRHKDKMDNLAVQAVITWELKVSITRILERLFEQS